MKLRLFVRKRSEIRRRRISRTGGLYHNFPRGQHGHDKAIN